MGEELKLAVSARYCIFSGLPLVCHAAFNATVAPPINHSCKALDADGAVFRRRSFLCPRRLSEQAHGSSAILHRAHPSYGETMLQVRSILHQMRSLFRPSTFQKKDLALEQEIAKLAATKPNNVTGRHMFLGEFSTQVSSTVADRGWGTPHQWQLLPSSQGRFPNHVVCFLILHQGSEDSNNVHQCFSAAMSAKTHEQGQTRSHTSRHPFRFAQGEWE